jgi:hypothetical protein
MFFRPRLAAAVFLLLAGVGLTSCSSSNHRYGFDEITFSHLSPFPLDVAVVDIVNDYRSPRRAPNAEHLFPVEPADAAMQWARDRLVAVGSNGSALFTVLQASAVEVPLEQTTGVEGFFTDEQSERYDAIVEVRLEVKNAQGMRTGTVTARAQRSMTVVEDATLNEREMTWYNLTEALMSDLNAELDRNIREHLAAFLR